MENAINQRIKEILKTRFSGNVSAFARHIGATQPSLNQLIKGDRHSSIRIILLILDRMPDVSAEWLMRGVEQSRGGNNVQIVNSVDSVAVGGDVNADNASEVVELRAERDRLLKIIDRLLAS